TMAEYINIDVKPDIDEIYAVNNKDIEPPEEYGDVAVMGDNKSNRLYFKLNKVIDGVDISEKEFRIFYENADGNSDMIKVEKSVSGNYVILVWQIDSNVTHTAGKVRYIIKVYDGEGYIWKSKPGEFEVCESLDGIVEPPEYTPHWQEEIAEDVANALDRINGLEDMIERDEEENEIRIFVRSRTENGRIRGIAINDTGVYQMRGSKRSKWAFTHIETEEPEDMEEGDIWLKK
ncbi:MAG: hypothetical protein IJ736_16175, partial [Firmicutes bacterium]|nr:hypothetical protein [Bacillota bacterium]